MRPIPSRWAFPSLMRPGMMKSFSFFGGARKRLRGVQWRSISVVQGIVKYSPLSTPWKQLVVLFGWRMAAQHVPPSS